MPTSRIRQFFKKYASPSSFGMGLIFGLLYTYLVFHGTTLDARIMFAFMFISGGLMGVIYFESRAVQSLTLPYIVEIIRIFFILWTFMGFVWVARIFGSDPPPQESWAYYLIAFLVGAIAGTVWTMALILCIGIRYDIGNWQVIRFPAWIGLAIQWLIRRAKSSERDRVR